jgi:26S proteasome regulatory subunit N2
LLVKLYSGLQEPDYISSSQCYVHLNEPSKCAELLQKLIHIDEYHTLLAYQIAFDLESSTTQEFLQHVASALPKPTTEWVMLSPTAGTSSSAAPTQAPVDAMDTDESTPLVKNEESSAAPTATSPLSLDTSPISQIHRILSGTLSIQLNLEFLHRNNHTDLLILKKTREALEKRSMTFHSAITVANAYANAGTTSDEFLRQNLEWLAKATNWTKFTATAALGVIHKVRSFSSFSLNIFSL